MTTVVLSGIFVFRWVLDSIADALNLKALRGSGAQAQDLLKREFEGLLDPERYERTLRYQAAVTRYLLVRRSATLCAFLAFLFGGGFGWARDLAVAAAGGATIWSELGFAGALAVLSSALSLPFDLYFTFVLEQRYGFNRTTLRTFVTDRIKGALISVILGVPVLLAIFWFFSTAGVNAWWISWLTLTGVQVGISFVAPVLIFPLFNRFEPLPQGEIRSAIEAYARSQKFSIEGIYTMDGSKRSTKANAFFAGFGRFRRLVLFDTLLSKQTPEELVAVVAHEVGHFRRGHILKSMAVSIAVSGGLFWVFQRAASDPRLFEAFQVGQGTLPVGLVLASIAAGPVLRLASFLSQAMSRKFEFEADEYSVQSYAKPRALASALKKLSVENLSNLTPHPFKVALDYSHPPVLQRVARLR